jgi:hypothetical protein
MASKLGYQISLNYKAYQLQLDFITRTLQDWEEYQPSVGIQRLSDMPPSGTFNPDPHYVSQYLKKERLEERAEVLRLILLSVDMAFETLCNQPLQELWNQRFIEGRTMASICKDLGCYTSVDSYSAKLRKVYQAIDIAVETVLNDKVSKLPNALEPAHYEALL